MLARAPFSPLSIAFVALLLSAPARAQSRGEKCVFPSAKLWAWPAAIALLLAFGGAARAQSAPQKPVVIYPPPRVHVFADLSYERASSARTCPDEGTFRGLVGAWMGIDSFKPNPGGVPVGRVRVEVSRSRGGFAASYTWDAAEGAKKTARFDAADCARALEHIAASLASLFMIEEIALGGKLAPKSAPPKKACPKARAPLPCPPPSTPIESPYSVWPREPSMLGPKGQPTLPDRWPLAVRLGLSAWPEIIATGWGSLGFSAELGVRYRFFSVGAELHGDPPLDSRLQHGVGEFNFVRLSGALLLCGHYGWFVGCGVLDVGRFFFLTDSQKLPASTHYGAAGARVGLEFPVAPPRFFLRAAFDLRAPILVKTYVHKDTTVFEAKGTSIGVGLGFVVEIGP